LYFIFILILFVANGLGYEQSRLRGIVYGINVKAWSGIFKDNLSSNGKEEWGGKTKDKRKKTKVSESGRLPLRARKKTKDK
jgi:hypothetical protein